MAHITLANETVPATPGSGNTVLYTETTLKKLVSLADDGVARVVQPLYNASTAQQSIATSDTYITGSNLTMPPSLVRAGATFQWTFGLTRSGAGTATPVYSIRFGTAGTTSDAQILSFTGLAQTNAADTGVHRIYALFRSVGAGTSAVLVGIFEEHHILTTTGLANAAQVQAQASASSGFNSTVASSIIGISVNPGATSTWLVEYATVIGFNL